MAERLRWRVALLLNRLPGQCWADLVSWALGSRFHRWPWCPQTDSCHRDAAECGACYCGALRAPVGGDGGTPNA